MECKLCNKIVKTKKGFHTHIVMAHKISLIDYYIKYENFNIPKCKICGKDAKLHKNISFYTTCGANECKYFGKQNVSEATREKIRKARFNILKNKNSSTAFYKRNKRIMSKIEEWFLEKVILKHNLNNSYDIVNEYPVYPYFIDFAFLNIKLAVEIDGYYHFINRNKIEHDMKKDKVLIEQGWKIYRIPYWELTEPNVIKFLDYLEKNNFIYDSKVLEQRLYNYKEYKKIKNNSKINKWKEKQQDNINKVINSGINFQIYGWKNLVAKLINIRQHHVARFMRRYLPLIYDSAIKVRPLKGNRLTWQQCKDRWNLMWVNRVKQINDSSINFKERGWSGKVAKVINISKSGVFSFMTRYLPEVYKSAYKK